MNTLDTFNQKLQTFGFIALNFDFPLPLGPHIFTMIDPPFGDVVLVIVGTCTKEEFIAQQPNPALGLLAHFYKAIAE